jgi:hypothetical protein
VVVATILDLEGTLSFWNFVLAVQSRSTVHMRRSNLKSHKDSTVRVRISHPLSQKPIIHGKKRVVIRSEPQTGRLAQTVLHTVDDDEIPELEDVFDSDDEDDEDDGGVHEDEDILDDMAVNTGESDPEPGVSSGTPVSSNKNLPVSLCPVFHIYISLNMT